MAAKQLMLPLAIVKKSNALCRARWHIESVYEPRLVALVASKIHKDDKDFCVYEIPIKEVIGVGADGRTYKLLEEAVDGLMGRIITMPKEHGWAKCTVFSYCEYDAKKSVIKVRFDPSMKPHYLELQEKFTQYNLMEFLGLPSTYSQRLYEILKSWDDKPEVTIDIPGLYEMLDIPPSLRANFAFFRRRVLEKAHKDINKKTTLEYEWEPIKKGRSVGAIRFIFAHESHKTSTRPPKAPPIKPQKKPKPDHVEAMECWMAKRRNGEQCPVRVNRDAGKREKCRICIEKLPVETWGV